jgi:hypothetical protein
MSIWPWSLKRPAPTSSPEGHGRPAEAGGGQGAVQGAARSDRACRSISTPMTRRASRRRRCWRPWTPASMPSMRRWMRCPATPRSPASARSSRRCGHRARSGPRSRMDPPYLLLLGSGAQPVRRLRKRPQGAGLGSLSARNAGRPVHQPQGAGALARAGDALAQVAQAYADANQMFGDIVKVTPSSKVVGDMALDDGQPGSDRRRCRQPGQGYRLPGIGRLDAEGRSRPAAGGWPEALQKKALKGDKPYHGAPRLAAQGQPISMPSARKSRPSSSARSAISNSPRT